MSDLYATLKSDTTRDKTSMGAKETSCMINTHTKGFLITVKVEEDGSLSCTVDSTGGYDNPRAYSRLYQCTL